MSEYVGHDLCAHTDKLQWLWIVFCTSAFLGFLPFTGPSEKLRSLVTRWASRGKIWSSEDHESVFQQRNSPLLTSKLWAVIWDSSVPQKWFWHFYLVGALWNAALTATHARNGFRSPCLSANHDAPRGITTMLLVLMQIQVMRRLYETLRVMKYRDGARMHLFVYIFGLSYYIAVSLSLFLHTPPSSAWRALPGVTLWAFQLAGVTFFVWGSWHQWRCHVILANLRKPPGNKGEVKHTSIYAIPFGDWFELVSCGHYLAEIILYFGLVVASGGLDPTIWLIFTFVVLNLTLSAMQTHDWYQRKFEDYPKFRRAIFPFVL